MEGSFSEVKAFVWLRLLVRLGEVMYECAALPDTRPDVYGCDWLAITELCFWAGD